MGYKEALEHLKDANDAIVVLRKNIARKTTTQNLSSAALDYTTDISEKWQISQIMIHSDTPLNETVKVYIDAIDGANYDTLIANEGFNGGTDMVLVAGWNMAPIIGEDGDEIKITCTNTGGAGIIYVTIKYTRLT